MFVRAVWQQRRLNDLKHSLRDIETPPIRSTDRRARSDFRAMTLGLFDR